MPQIINEDVAKAVTEIHEFFIEKRQSEAWGEGFGGAVVITLPTNEDGRIVGNLAGYPSAHTPDNFKMIMDALLSFMIGLILMGVEDHAIAATHAYAKTLAEGCETLDLMSPTDVIQN